MKLMKSERGQTLALFVAMIGVFIASMMVVVDYGLGVSVKSKIQSTVDSAALAGASLLPSDPAGAIARAQDFASKNGIPVSNVTVTFPNNPPTMITVTAQQTTSNAFSKFFGFSPSSAGAHATAMDGPPDAMSNAVPITVDQTLYQDGVDLSFQADQNVNLSLCKKGTDCPAFVNVILGQPGLNYFRNVMMYGYPGTINAADVLQQNGNNGKTVLDAAQYRMSLAPNETWSSFAPGSPRLIYVPITTALPTPGQGTYKIVGFGAFFISSVMRRGTTQGLITGRFLHYMPNSGTGHITHPWKQNPDPLAPPPPDFHLRVVQLIE